MFTEHEVLIDRNCLVRLIGKRRGWFFLGRDIRADSDIDVYDALLLKESSDSDWIEAVVLRKEWVKDLGRWAVFLSLDEDLDPVEVYRNGLSFEEFESGESLANAIDFTGGGKITTSPSPGKYQVFPPRAPGSLIWNDWLLK